MLGNLLLRDRRPRILAQRWSIRGLQPRSWLRARDRPEAEFVFDLLSRSGLVDLPQCTGELILFRAPGALQARPF